MRNTRRIAVGIAAVPAAIALMFAGSGLAGADTRPDDHGDHDNHSSLDLGLGLGLGLGIDGGSGHHGDLDGLDLSAVLAIVLDVGIDGDH